MPLCALVLLAGCAAQDPGATVTRDGISDPFEERNRNVHEFNKTVDRAVLRPLSRGYTRAVPEDLRLVADNFRSSRSVMVTSSLGCDTPLAGERRWPKPEIAPSPKSWDVQPS